MTGKPLEKLSGLDLLKGLIVFFLLLSMSAYADTISSAHSAITVKIKANHLNYNETDGIIKADGSVEARFQNIIMRSGTMILNTNTNIATAEHDVALIKENYNTTAQKIIYNFKTDESTVENLSVVFLPKEIKGKVFLGLKNIKDTVLLKKGQGCIVTTCDQTKPHYHIEAAEIIFVPEDRVTATNVTVYFGAVPTLWLPHYYYDLKKRRAALLMPVIGSNNVEGDYVKTETQYYLDEGSNGSLYLDFMKRKGNGIGVMNNYVLNRFNSGSCFLYRLDETTTGTLDVVTRIDHDIRLTENAKLKLKYYYQNTYLVPAGRLDQTEAGAQYSFDQSAESLSMYSAIKENRVGNRADYMFRLNRRSLGSESDYQMGYAGELSSSKWQNTSFNFRHSGSISKDLTFSLNSSYYKNLTAEGTPFDERIDSKVDLNYRASNYAVRLTESIYVDPDQNVNNSDAYLEYVEQLPEVAVTFNPVQFLSANVRADAAFGKYHESKTVYLLGSAKTQRHFMSNIYRLSVNMDKVFELPLNSKFSINDALSQFYYETGDERYTQNLGMQLSTAAGGFYTNRHSFARSYSAGSSPFYFDARGSESHYIRDEMSFFNGDKHRLTLTGGYNYLTYKSDDINLFAESNQGDGLNLSVSSGYDVENVRWKDLVTVASMLPFKGFKDVISHSYDMNTGRTRVASNSLDWEIGGEWTSAWHISLKHYYDYMRDSISLTEASIIKDLHCWEARYTWSDARKEFRIAFALKAMPDSPLGYASQNNGFFVEGIKNENAARY